MRVAWRQKKGKLWQRRLITLAVAAAFGTEIARGAPTGPVVVSGQVGFSQQGKLLSITNTPGAIINWQSFSIGKDEVTRFIQQSAASTVLNRVTGVDPSQILGALQSNGRVFLINPNGVLFGAGAQVNVGGLVVSSLNLSDKDFQAGRMRFTDTPGAGKVSNQGTINATGGPVYLVAPAVDNSGTISTVGGDIILAAGKTVQLVDPQSPDVRIEVSAPANQAVNIGQLLTERGHVGIYAGMIRNSGTIRASGATLNEKGEVVLVAKKDVTLEKTSVITANGPSGGRITIEAQEGKATIAGTVEARSLGAPRGEGQVQNQSPLPRGEGQGEGAAGKGGTISIAGHQGVTVDAGARISANGADGGSVTLSSAAGSVTIAAPVTANAASGRAGQIAVSAAGTVTLANGAQLSASGGQGGGVVTVKGSAGVAFEAGSVVQAAGAAGGTVSVQADAGAFIAQGTIEVSGVEQDGGSVNIAARNDITLEISSRILANGRAGGEMRMESSEGTLLASGLINGLGSNGPGGKVYLLAPRVALLRRAVVDVSGDTGGGTVLVGGDYAGKNTNIQNARTTYVGSDVTLRADAVTSGDGGRIIVWADDTALVYGAISARGGAQSGDGGFVETSGKHYLEVKRGPELSAPHGKGGTWLLDPFNITVTTVDLTITDVDATANADYRGTASNSTIAAATIQGVLNAGNNVIIDTTGAGADAGNITVSSAIAKTAGGAATLTLKAHNNIAINAGISSTSGALNLTLVPDQDAAGGGASTIGASGSPVINLNGGTLQSSGALTVQGSATISNATVTTTGGVGLSVVGTATLDGVTLRGTLDLSGASSIARIFTGLTLLTEAGGAPGVANVTGSNALLAFQGTQSFDNATINLGSATTAGNLNNEGAGTLTLGAGATVQGRGTIGSQSFVGGSGTLINQGTISANLSGQTLSIAGNGVSTFTNQGTLQATNGGLLTINPANWTNAGTIKALANSTVNLNGTITTGGLGAFDATAAGAVINVVGTINNAAQTLTFSPATGSLTMLGGTIQGGTIQESGTNRLIFTSSAGTLDGVTLRGTLDLSSANSTARIFNGLTLLTEAGATPGVANVTGSNALLAFQGTQSFDNATINLGSATTAAI